MSGNGSNVFASEMYEVEGVGTVEVTTLNFDPPSEGNWDFCGFESVLKLPDGRQFGHGPEHEGETPAQLHASWTHEQIRHAWNYDPPTDKRLRWQGGES